MRRDDLDTAFVTATQKPHGFLWLAYNAPEGSKMYSGFTKRLILKWRRSVKSSAMRWYEGN